jgi:hypothetical protein
LPTCPPDFAREISESDAIGAAAVHFLSGIDPVGTPLLRASALERDVWLAVTMRADRLMEASRGQR